MFRSLGAAGMLMPAIRSSAPLHIYIYIYGKSNDWRSDAACRFCIEDHHALAGEALRGGKSGVLKLVGP